MLSLPRALVQSLVEELSKVPQAAPPKKVSLLENKNKLKTSTLLKYDLHTIKYMHSRYAVQWILTNVCTCVTNTVKI